MRYYNKLTKTEAIEGIHTIDENCVQLPGDHLFWKPLPGGKQIGYDENDLPILVDIILEPLTAEQIIESLYNACRLQEAKICDDNYRDLLNNAKVILKLDNTKTLTKCLESVAYLDSLWNEYYNRRDNLIENYDFSTFNNMPNSYQQLRSEIENS